MYRSVSGASNILKSYNTKPSSGLRNITPEMQKSLDEADKPKKGGNKVDKKKGVSEGPSIQVSKQKK